MINFDHTIYSLYNVYTLNRRGYHMFGQFRKNEKTVREEFEGIQKRLSDINNQIRELSEKKLTSEEEAASKEQLREELNDVTLELSYLRSRKGLSSDTYGALFDFRDQIEVVRDAKMHDKADDICDVLELVELGFLSQQEARILTQSLDKLGQELESSQESNGDDDELVRYLRRHR